MIEPGKYYLFACPWDWTYVGRFRGIVGGKAIIDHAIYFCRTGARFGDLCRTGLVPKRGQDDGSIVSECGDGIDIGCYLDVKAFPWHAPVTWKNPDAGRKG